ncbi:MAG: hypothetical protein L6R42_009315 [Xanthoria sp. 1 TBL-2021]|nr:MAG: hypothetical protein L6R42_009315 [Xanthoria sp. 1 TBL-2021]
MHIIGFFVLVLSFLIEISFSSRIPSTDPSASSAEFYVRHDAPSIRHSSALLPRAILPGAPRSYLRVAVRHLAMIIPSPVYNTRTDIRLYNIVAAFLSEIIQNVNGLIPDPNKRRTWLQAWSDTPPLPTFIFQQGALQLLMRTDPGQTIPWEFVDWFCNEMRHGAPAYCGGGGYASFFQEWFQTEAGQIIYVVFGASGPWQAVYNTQIEPRINLLGEARDMTLLRPPGP